MRLFATPGDGSGGGLRAGTFQISLGGPGSLGAGFLDRWFLRDGNCLKMFEV